MPIRPRRAAARSSSSRRLKSSPAIRIRPESARSSPDRIAISEDLPEPEGPSSATFSPASTARSIPFNMSTRADPLPSARRTAPASMMVDVMRVEGSLVFACSQHEDQVAPDQWDAGNFLEHAIAPAEAGATDRIRPRPSARWRPCAAIRAARGQARSDDGYRSAASGSRRRVRRSCRLRRGSDS